VALRDRLNHTHNGLSGQPTVIVAIPPRPTPPLAAPALPPAALALPPAALPIPPAIPTAAPPATPIAAPAAPTTPPSPPPTRYLYPSTARDRLNHTLNGLAISPESAQPTPIATTPPRTQTPTPTTP